MAEKKSKQVLAAEKRRQKKQEAENTLRRETKDATSVTGAGRYKKMYPHELGVVGNLKYQAEKGVEKAKEVGKDVVEGVKNMGSTAKKALKTLQNPTAAEKKLEGKAYGGKVKQMANGGMPMVKKDGKMVPSFAVDGVGKMSYGGKVKKMADGKMVTKKKKTTKVARRRGDGCAVKGKTRGRMV
jgi:hypothetical protein